MAELCGSDMHASSCLADMPHALLRKRDPLLVAYSFIYWESKGGRGEIEDVVRDGMSTGIHVF